MLAFRALWKDPKSSAGVGKMPRGKGRLYVVTVNRFVSSRPETYYVYADDIDGARSKVARVARVSSDRVADIRPE
jgi:hypothetical protein